MLEGISQGSLSWTKSQSPPGATTPGIACVSLWVYPACAHHWLLTATTVGAAEMARGERSACQGLPWGGAEMSAEVCLARSADDSHTGGDTAVPGAGGGVRPHHAQGGHRQGQEAARSQIMYFFFSFTQPGMRPKT